MEIKNKIKKIAVIGAGGGMGSWFTKFFAREEFEVFTSDTDGKKLLRLKKEMKVHSAKLSAEGERLAKQGFKRVNLAKNNKEAVKSADLILISVLLKNFEGAVQEISPWLKENQIVIDITSLKEKPVQIMHRFLRKNLTLGTHPLFGPVTEAGAEKQNFFLTPTRKREKTFAKEFGGWLRKKGFNVIETTPKEHDRLMTFILGLPHFIGLAAGSTLAKLDVKKLKEVSGPSFKKLLDLVQNVAFSSFEFYSELHLELPEINKIENLFAKEIGLWQKIIKEKRAGKFIKKMAKIKDALI